MHLPIAHHRFFQRKAIFILRYAIAYVNESTGIEKHIMRYPQLFATKAIKKARSRYKKRYNMAYTGKWKTALHSIM